MYIRLVILKLSVQGIGFDFRFIYFLHLLGQLVDFLLTALDFHCRACNPRVITLSGRQIAGKLSDKIARESYGLTAVVTDDHVDVTPDPGTISPPVSSDTSKKPRSLVSGLTRGGVILTGLGGIGGGGGGGGGSSIREEIQKSPNTSKQQRQQPTCAGSTPSAVDLEIAAPASENPEPCTSNGSISRGVHGVRFEMPVSSYAETTDVEESTNGHTPINVDDAQEGKTRWDWSNRQSKLVIGTFVSMIIAVAWVSLSQLIQNVAEAPDIKAPFTITYLFMICPVLLFPAYLCVARLAKAEPIKDIFSECLHVYRGSEEFHRLPFLWKSLMFCLVSTLTTYTYIRALYKLSAADCTALFAANHSFVYLLSWIVLFEKFIALRILAMIFSITGIVLFAYVDGFGSPAMFGVVMGVASSAGAAVYGVLYKKFIGDATSAQAAFFISVVGLLSLLLLWPIWLLLYLLGAEQIEWSVLPWGMILPSAFLATVYWGIKECAVQLTYQFFIGMGLVLAIPICSVADTVWKEKDFPGMKIAALVLITIGVILILLPENWHEYICKHVRSKQRDSEQQTIGNSTTLRGRLSRTSYM
ncbi:hypothetical protein Btru_009697 [Bulinus truncatus]|nr:hypothetical protein Btru_009697 [Bulinus truncatus]